LARLAEVKYRFESEVNKLSSLSKIRKYAEQQLSADPLGSVQKEG
jgi:hypothetical protein